MKKKLPTEIPLDIVLSPGEAEEIAVIEKRVIDLKLRLANVVIQQMILSQDVVRAEKDMYERVNDVANLHGIKPEEAGSWALDTTTMKFRKKIPQQ